MTADRRLLIGGWAALFVAILAPLELAALFLSAGEPDPFAAPAVRVIAAARAGCLIAAVIGVDHLFRSIASEPARIVRIAGVVGSILGLGVVVIQGSPSAGVVGAFLPLAASVLTGLWFIGGGAILMSAGRQLARVGWTAALGGAAVIVTALARATNFGGPIGTGTSWIDWFYLIGLFVVIYLVRVWMYVIRGRLPGPGIL